MPRPNPSVQGAGKRDFVNQFEASSSLGPAPKSQLEGPKRQLEGPKSQPEGPWTLRFQLPSNYILRYCITSTHRNLGISTVQGIILYKFYIGQDIAKSRKISHDKEFLGSSPEGDKVL